LALTRAQLLMGDSSQGTVLTGQVQAVRSGAGISIDGNGVITIDSQSVLGVMKLGQTTALANGAYNGYNWPTATGTAGQQITISSVAAGITTLAWGDPDQIPWTAKGQLVVGTGANAQTLLNVGTDGQILIADSGAGSGLGYTSNYVSTTGATGAANIPAGTTGQQPVTPNTGAFRYNSTLTSLEFYNGAAWEVVASSSSNSFVEKTSNTGSAVMPAGTLAQRDGAPAAGYMRFNDDSDTFEFWNGASWQTVASSSSGAFVSQTVPTAGTPSAIIPTGTTAQQQTLPLPLAGYTRFNTDTTLMEVFNGAIWTPIGAPPNAGLGLNLSGVTPNQILKASTPVAVTPPVAGTALAQAIDGSMYWDSTLGQLFIRYNDGTTTQWVAAAPPGATSLLNPATLAEAAVGTVNTRYSSPETAVPKNAAGMTGAAILPSGTSAQQPGSPAAGWIRYNTTLPTNNLEVYSPSLSTWRQLQYVPASTPLPPDLTISANTALGGVQYVNNLTINAGVTVTVSNQGLAFICTGSAVINGTINGAGKGSADGGQQSITNGGSTSSQKGFGPGGYPYTPSLFLNGTGGASGDVATGAGGVGVSSTGGRGGAYVAIRTYGNLTLGATANINTSGDNAIPSTLTPAGGINVIPWAASGGAGGSAGAIILHSDGNLTVAGSLTATGGNGAAGQTLGFTGATGGSGAGGGVVILQTNGTLTNTATVNLAGGLAGSTAGLTGILGGAGGPSAGGAGGAASGAGAANPGSAGYVTYQGSPF
jgi:hypothetical protein